MSNNNEAAQRWRTRSGAQQSNEQQQPHDTTPDEEAQDVRAPDGDMCAYLRGNLIYVAGQHLASIKGHELHRTFDSRRELLDGCLFFRIDVLYLAELHGAQSIVVRDQRTKKVWRTGMDTFRACGHLYSHPRFGDQWGMPLSEFDLVVPPDPPEQLRLQLGGGL